MNTKAETQAVKVGQVWRDNDKRANRTCEVREIDGNYATVYCRESKKFTDVRLDRFRPTATGYRLIEDVA